MSKKAMQQMSNEYSNSFSILEKREADSLGV